MQNEMGDKIIPNEIGIICFNFYFIELVSKILTNEECVMFTNMLREDEKYTNGYDFKLLFRASEHGRGNTKFIEYCHNQRNIFVLIETTTNHVFGGFTSVGWFDDHDRFVGDVSDEKAFLFLLRSDKHKPRIGHINENYVGNALQVGYSNNVCRFGNGGDIAILNDWDNKDSYCGKKSYTFNLPQSPEFDLNTSSYFRIKEIEAFQVT